MLFIVGAYDLIDGRIPERTRQWAATLREWADSGATADSAATA